MHQRFHEEETLSEVNATSELFFRIFKNLGIKVSSSSHDRPIENETANSK